MNIIIPSLVLWYRRLKSGVEDEYYLFLLYV